MPVSIEIIPFDHKVTAEVEGCWRDCIAKSSNFRACLQTPEWFSYRWNSSNGHCYLAILSQSEISSPLAVTPVVQSKYDLPFSVGGKVIATVSFGGSLINGNVPLFPPCNVYYQELVEAVLSMPNTQCLYVLGTPKVSPFWNFLTELGRNRSGLILYTPGQKFNRYFFIDMRGSYDEYLNKFKSKTLQTFRRKNRLLEKVVGTKIELDKIVNVDQVRSFLKEAQKLAELSWQKWLVGIDLSEKAGREELLKSYAKRGWLRCYLLKAKNKPLAYAIGFQVNGVLYFQSTAYDPRFSQFSPGQYLLLSMIKDCFESNKPEMFHFGTGEAEYKEFFANRSGEEVTLMILKRTFANEVKILAHKVFRKTVDTIKIAGRLVSM